MKATLPYPPSKLSPNKRLHWAALAKAKRDYRWTCAMHARAAGWRLIDRDRIAIKITFCPPDKRRRDRDNMIAAFKSGADGLVDVIGVDDANWTPTYSVGDPIKGGCVRVEIADD